jgi:hypothetical protein
MSFRTLVFGALTGIAVWALARSVGRRVQLSAERTVGARRVRSADPGVQRPLRHATSAVQQVVIEGRQISIPLAIWDGSLELDTEEKAG